MSGPLPEIVLSTNAITQPSKPPKPPKPTPTSILLFAMIDRTTKVKDGVKAITFTTTIDGEKFVVTDRSIARKPDDIVYRRSREVWEMVPRGMADCESHDIQLRGLPKFGYEDDLKHWSYGEPSGWAKMHFVTKENGECFHVTAKRDGNRLLLMMGSKNVHFCFPVPSLRSFFENKAEHLAKAREAYTTMRFTYAHALAKQFADSLHDDVRFDQLEDILCKYTACAEACDMDRAEHLVRYDRPTMRWFALTSGVRDKSFVSVETLDARRMFVDCHLDVPCEVETFTDLDESLITDAKRRWESRENSEGAVVYCVDRAGNTISVFKHKNDEYTIIRAVREKMRANCTRGQVKHRLHNMHITVPDDLRYELLKFHAWVQTKRTCGELTSEDLSDRFLSTLEKFRAEGSPDMIDHMPEDVTLPRLILVGAPCQGSGKTRLSFVLRELLNARRLCQDDLGKGFRAELKKVLKNPDNRNVIIDKYNGEQNRMEAERASGGAHQMVYVALLHPDGRQATLDLCRQRIRERGMCHPCLKSDVSNLDSITSGFYDRWSMPNNSFGTIIRVDPRDSTEDQVRTVFASLELDLPDDDVMKRGIARHEAYEKALAEKQQQKATVYWSIDFDEVTARQIDRILPIGAMEPFDEHHVTLGFVKACDMRALDKIMGPLEGSDQQVRVIGYVMDDKILSAIVDVSVPHMQTGRTHISVAREGKTTKSYSNELIAKVADQVVMLDEPRVFTGKITRHV